MEHEIHCTRQDGVGVGEGDGERGSNTSVWIRVVVAAIMQLCGKEIKASERLKLNAVKSTGQSNVHNSSKSSLCHAADKKLFYTRTICKK